MREAWIGRTYTSFKVGWFISHVIKQNVNINDRIVFRLIVTTRWKPRQRRRESVIQVLHTRKHRGQLTLSCTIMFGTGNVKVFKRWRIRCGRWSHCKRVVPRHFVERKYITHTPTAKQSPYIRKRTTRVNVFVSPPIYQCDNTRMQWKVWIYVF
jgi:hypothetical protein